MDTGVERHVAALGGIDRQAAGDQRRRHAVLRREQSLERQRGRDLGAVQQGQTFLRLQHQRLEPAAASPSAAGTVLPPTVTSPTPIRAAVRWASGARSPEAPTEPLDGITGRTP